MPNHPAVEPILRGAADMLGAWTGDPSLSGYQSKDPARVYTMAGAIYSAPAARHHVSQPTGELRNRRTARPLS